MKLIRNEVRILLDRMKEHPEEFETPAKTISRWPDTFARVRSVATLPERFMLRRAAKQVIRENAYRSVMTALLPPEVPEYKHIQCPISTGNIVNQAAMQNIAANTINRYYEDAHKQYDINRQQSLMNAGMSPYGGLLGDPRVTDLFGKTGT